MNGNSQTILPYKTIDIYIKNILNKSIFNKIKKTDLWSQFVIWIQIFPIS